MSIRCLVIIAGLAAAPAAAQTFVMVADSSNDRVSLFNPNDGSLVNASFIVNQAGFTFTSPKDAIQVGSEVWVSDQVNDAIYRFDLAGIYISTIGGGPTGGLNNVRGMEFIGTTVYVTSSDAGNGSPGANSVIKFDATGANLGSFTGPVGPFDVFPLSATEILVSGGSNNPDVTRHDLAGALLGTWTNGTIAFAEQITRRTNGEFLIAGFTDGQIHRYDATGIDLGNLFAAPGARGVFELGNGDILWTAGSGVNVRNLTTGLNTIVQATTGAQFANLLTLPANPCYANCDGVGGLTANDFACFLAAYTNAFSYADCDGIGGLTANDFACFLSAYTNGCS